MREGGKERRKGREERRGGKGESEGEREKGRSLFKGGEFTYVVYVPHSAK